MKQWIVLAASLLVIGNLFIGCSSSEDLETADGSSFSEGGDDFLSEDGSQATDGEVNSEDLALDSPQEDGSLDASEEFAEGSEFSEGADQLTQSEEEFVELGEGDAGMVTDTGSEGGDTLALGGEDPLQDNLAEPQSFDTPAPDTSYDSSPLASSDSEFGTTDTSGATGEFSSNDGFGVDAGTSDFGAGSDDSFASVESGPKMIPVKKIPMAPYDKNGRVVNTVYIAREGDDLSSISQKIYGDDRSAELLETNGHLHRGVKTGDKVFYNSPRRPTDSSSFLTYQEDQGIAPQTYVTQPNDNIRELGNTLLGNRESWKELWATNQNIESKWDLPEGLELRYWPQGASDVPLELPPPPAQDLAMNNPEPSAGGFDNSFPPPPPSNMGMGGDFPPPPAGGNDLGLPPPDMAGNDLPPPGNDDFLPPPAMGSVDSNPPPPPSKPQAKMNGKSSVLGGDMDQDTTFMMLAGGVLLVGGGIILAIVRKNRARKMMNESQTQI
ncbi:MAG: hypothetical protein COT74_11540 [Bdellovibrionales bacterium CG10_big_fil_rev_8_21_14_0_10_45_34]|nr:MAG: hypothetical protein COT74_11540 [Bdellovibrionales bacterium CG10_big_fil_rev_8_21_14_0_10_45_34]